MVDPSTMQDQSYSGDGHVQSGKRLSRKNFQHHAKLAPADRVITVRRDGKHHTPGPAGAIIEAAIRRLEKNKGGYFGESIDIHALLAELRNQAGPQAGRWICCPRGMGQNCWPCGACRPTGPPHLSLRRHPRRRTGRAAGRPDLAPGKCLARRRGHFSLPCLNPTGFKLNQRESDQGIDLNRDYRQPGRRKPRRTSAGWKKQPLLTCASACTKTGRPTAFTFMK